MLPTVNNYDKRYARVNPSQGRYFYSCKDCGEVISDRQSHNIDHVGRNSSPVIVFAKMSEIVTILWGQDGT